MSAEVPEAASAEEQKVSGSREQAREAPSRPHRGPGPAGGLLPPRAEGRAGPDAEWVAPVRLGCEGGTLGRRLSAVTLVISANVGRV